jgi:hypothetical protein
MKLNIKNTALIGLILMSLFSCKDFLDVKPKGQVIPEKLVDYELMFNSLAMTNLVPDLLESATDDGYSIVGTEANTTAANAYFWRKDLDIDVEIPPVIWANNYNKLYYCNYIINNVLEATEASLTEKKSLLAQARVIRALNYLYTLTAFANAYDPAKNPNDLGVPLVTSTNVTDKVPLRSTLKECFDYMINDLTLAMDDLPVQHKDRWRVTKYVAAGVFARVYLYAHNYVKANEYATLALQSTQTNKILDYNTFASITNFPVPGLNNEKLWLDYTSVAVNANYAKQLLNLYTADDLRLKLFSKVNASAMVYRAGNTTNAGISYPELYLTQAEYLARNNQPNPAMDIVNLIRKNRLPANTANLNLSAGTAAQALILVLEERRRELAFSGVRWLDMKRLDQEGMMPVVSRYPNNDPTATAIASLQPKSKGYTFEIPLKVQLLNSNIQLNY